MVDARARAVIFDMDGVLVDSEPVNVEALAVLLAAHGVRYTEAENDEFVGVSDREHFTALRERYRLGPTVEELIKRWTGLVLQLIPTRSRPRPGVPEVLERLSQRSYRLALASSALRPVIDARLAALGVAEHFPVIVSALDVARGKPAPDVFLAAAARLGVPPDRCLVVEDSRNGLLAAKAAGMRCAVVPSPATRLQAFAEADFLLGGLPDLLGILDRPD
jgi:HAD superfamily hydrolase (TIGR01509 family)